MTRAVPHAAVRRLINGGMDTRKQPDAPASSEPRDGALTDSGAASGAFVTETFGYGGGRQVTAYLPPVSPEAVVFAGDGQRIAKWGRLIEKAGIRSTMIVGVHGLPDEMQRLHEYSPGFEPERFTAHESFFVDEVHRWTESRFGVALPPEKTAVFGVSAAGELALAHGLRHPRVYGAVFCASPGGGYRPPAVMPSPLPRTYLVSGTQEPFFSRTRSVGRSPYATQVRRWLCRNGLVATAERSGEESSR